MSTDRNIKTLDEALAKIAALENENAVLREELETYKNRKMSGRKKHNDKWMKAYNDFAICFASGMSVVEVAEKHGVSERTIYRYKSYYDAMNANGPK